MAASLFSRLRKSYINNLFFTSIVSNLVMYGQPVQQIVLQYCLSKEQASYRGGVSNYYTDADNVISKEAETKIMPANPLPAYVPEEAYSVFYASEKSGVIGSPYAEGVENLYDNFFTFRLPDNADFNKYEVVLSYELFGLGSAAQTTKSINGNIAYGGNIITPINTWIAVSENLSASSMKPGKNEVYFNRRQSEGYEYKIRNIRIELKDKKPYETAVKVADGKIVSYNNGVAYISGVTEGVEISQIEINGEYVKVVDGVFEGILHNITPAAKKITLNYLAGNVKKSTVIPLEHSNSTAEFSFNTELNINNMRFTEESLLLGKQYSGLCLEINESSKNNTGWIEVSGLKFKDIRTLNEDLENVTAGEFESYRIKKVNLSESTGVKLNIKYDPEKIPAGYTAKDIKTFYYDNRSRSWKGIDPDYIDLENNEIVTTIYNNETDYINGIIKVPDSPETGSFTPTTISDMKYADPASGVVSIQPPSANNTGNATTSFPIKLPQGRGGMQPSLQVSYNSDAGNGWMGIGWTLATPAITLNTKWGSPLFNSEYETEMYSLNGSDLVLYQGDEYTTPNRTATIIRNAERLFYERKEGAFLKIVRHKSDVKNYCWEVTDKQGNKSFYGGIDQVDDNAVMRDNNGNITHWALKKTQDTYGNYVEYFYDHTTPAISSTVTGKGFYIQKIQYTKHSANVGNYYEVEFNRNTYSTTVPNQSNAQLNRADVIINGRDGYLNVIKDLLTEIKISFIQSGQPVKTIRKYRFDYNNAILGKTQLEQISEVDSQGNLFYSNTMEYYGVTGGSSIISNTGTSWQGNEDTGIVNSLMPSIAGLDAVGSALGTSTTIGGSFGLRGGFGLGTNPSNISATIGVSGNYSINNLNTTISFIDINGDGLPDKVISNSDGTYYRPNLGVQTSFGEKITISGLALSKTKSRTVGAGVDATYSVLSIGRSWSKTKSTTDGYFSDVNGDGLVDIITDGRVKFNRTTASQTDPAYRSFDTNVNYTENKIVPGIITADIVPSLELETLDELREQNPQFDHVLVWEAPFDGIINITGAAKLIAKNPGTQLNNFRLTIEKAGADTTSGNATQWLTEEGNSVNTLNTSVSMGLNSKEVNKGDRIFFRIHNKQYGYGGTYEWNPKITYTSIDNFSAADLNMADENGKSIKVYDAKDDFIMNNGGDVKIPGYSLVNVNFNLPVITPAISALSDTTIFSIKVYKTNISSGATQLVTTYRKTFIKFLNALSPINVDVPGNSSVILPNDDIQLSLDYSGGAYSYSLACYISSYSNVDWQSIQWQPSFSDADNSVAAPTVLPLSPRIFDNNIHQKRYWFNGADLPYPTIDPNVYGDENQQMLKISHNFLNQNFGSLVEGDSYATANWVIKVKSADGTVSVLQSLKIYIYKDETTNQVYLLRSYNLNDVIDLNSSLDAPYWQYILTKNQVKDIIDNNKTIYSAFYLEDDSVDLSESNCKIILSIMPSGYSFPINATTELTKPFIARTRGLISFNYRGWNRFLYNGGLQYQHNNDGDIIPNSTVQNFGDNPVSMSIFSYTQAQVNQLNGYQNDPSTINADNMQMGDTAVRYTHYNQNNSSSQYANEAIIGCSYILNTNGTLTTSVGRFGEANLYDVYVDPATITQAPPTNMFPGMKQRSSSKGAAVSGGISYASGTYSEADSKVLNQYIDLNGDRYPEMVTGGKIQYTNMLGSLTTLVKENDFSSGDSSTDKTFGVTIPCQQPNSTSSSGSPAGKNKTRTNIDSGVNTSDGESHNAFQWVDINGDGLADKVLIKDNQDVLVHLNTGYGFTEEIDWTPVNLGVSFTTSLRENASVSVSGGGNFGQDNSMAMGVGGAYSTANMQTMLTDVDGDGLPDLIVKNVSSYIYFRNTGIGFDNQQFPLYNQNDIERDRSISVNTFFALTFGFGFTIFGVPFKVTITPSIGANVGLNQKLSTLQDIDGDGLPDVLLKDDNTNGDITAHLNIVGQAHLLKKVNMALGGNWFVQYARTNNTYDMPNSKWVVYRVTTNDGFTQDNEYRPGIITTETSYQDPKYNRREREFLGFGNVYIRQINNLNQVYRTLVKSYHTDNYYLSGCEKSSMLLDASGELLTKEETLYNLLDPNAPAVNMAASESESYIQPSLLNTTTASVLLDKTRLFIAVAKVTSTTYEGSDSLTSVKEFTSYDTHGNLTTYIDRGEGPDDAYNTVITYETSIGMLENAFGFPKTIKVYKNTNLLTPVRQRQAAYNSSGKLDTITTTLNDTEQSTVKLLYDSFGNLKEVDALDNKNSTNTNFYKKNIEYDTVLNTFPVHFSNSYGEHSYIAYNYLFGIPVLTTDINNKQMRTRIDNRGRVVEVTGPNELATETSGTPAWTIRMEYEGLPATTATTDPYVLIASGSYMAVMPGYATPENSKHFALTRHYDSQYVPNGGGTSTNHLLTVSLSDGFGQPLQVKKGTEVEGQMKWLVSGVEKKDNWGRTIETYLPIIDNVAFPSNTVSLIPASSAIFNFNPGISDIDPVVMEYDSKDRVVSVQQPGESDVAYTTYTIEEGMLVQRCTNELSQTVASYTDVRGRQRKTVQNDEITTTFSYNAINELLKVTDNQGYETTYLYDMAGRKIRMNHPDRGSITFKYDKASRMTEQSNSNLLIAGGLKIQYYYNYERLIRVAYPQNPQNEVKYTYGAPTDQLAVQNNAIGRLLYQEDASGVQLFGYGNMGELTKHLRSVAVAGYQSYWFYTGWEYDSWNRVRKIVYPDQEEVTYNYDKAGTLNKINSQMNGITSNDNANQQVIKDINYNEYGERSSITYGNDTRTIYRYDDRRRLQQLHHAFADFTYNVSREYNYDALSNITGINAGDPESSLPGPGQIGGPVNHSYKYDSYNRLEHAEGNYTGANDFTTPYLRQQYTLDMKYNLDHTIVNKTLRQWQGEVNNASDPVDEADGSPVKKSSYALDYKDYATGAYVAEAPVTGAYGYQQPHAVRTIIETPTYVENLIENDPRIREKKLLYDANGNQTEIKETVGELEISLRKNLWDEENRLRAVNLKPDDPTDHPIAIYTYDAGGQRVVRYNYDRIDVSSNANEVAQKVKDNVMLYPSALMMGKAVHGRENINTLVYTKHYYIGSERISAKTGTLNNFGFYPESMVNDRFPGLASVAQTLIRNPSTATVTEAQNTVSSIHTTFGVTAPAFSPVVEPVNKYNSHTLALLHIYYFHPDHLGSSSYMTNASGQVCQHIEYLPFGETLVEEHLNSNNSPFKFNGKEFDEETGNYYYGARYYDPKMSIFIGVDPLADKYPGISPFAYCFNNPVRFIDPTGMESDDCIDPPKPPKTNIMITINDQRVIIDNPTWETENWKHITVNHIDEANEFLKTYLKGAKADNIVINQHGGPGRDCSIDQRYMQIGITDNLLTEDFTKFDGINPASCDGNKGINVDGVISVLNLSDFVKDGGNLVFFACTTGQDERMGAAIAGLTNNRLNLYFGNDFNYLPMFGEEKDLHRDTSAIFTKAITSSGTGFDKYSAGTGKMSHIKSIELMCKAKEPIIFK